MLKDLLEMITVVVVFGLLIGLFLAAMGLPIGGVIWLFGGF